MNLNKTHWTFKYFGLKFKEQILLLNLKLDGHNALGKYTCNFVRSFYS